MSNTSPVRTQNIYACIDTVGKLQFIGAYRLCLYDILWFQKWKCMLSHQFISQARFYVLAGDNCPKPRPCPQTSACSKSDMKRCLTNSKHQEIGAKERFRPGICHNPHCHCSLSYFLLWSICGIRNSSQQMLLQRLSTNNMVFSDENKILIKSLYLKRYTAKRLTD